MKLFVLALIALAALAASDTWSKVRDLKTGTELRIYKKGAPQPVLATMDEATDDKLIVVVKNEQAAIAKEDIDRIDYRPTRKGSRVTKETTTTTTDNHDKVAAATPEAHPVGPSSSTSTNFSIQGKPDFETIYRRAPAAK